MKVSGLRRLVSEIGSVRGECCGKVAGTEEEGAIPKYRGGRGPTCDLVHECLHWLLSRRKPKTQVPLNFLAWNV